VEPIIPIRSWDGTDRQVAAGHAQSDADFLREAALLYAEELEEDEDLWTIAQAGIADADAIYESTMPQVRANLAAGKT